MAVDIYQLFQDILAFDPDRHRFNHLLKVTGYAQIIGLAEGMSPEDLAWLQVATILHDIGIKPSLSKYYSADGQYQQVEGPPLAREILSRQSLPPERIDRVCFLIAHHHEYSQIDALDYQILVEADFLVNCDEGKMATPAILSVRDKIFRTRAGTHLLSTLFQLE